MDEITQLIELNQALAGLNITVPFKESVMALLHELDITASEIGAVNCIKITRENNQCFLKGYNTDVFGFSES